MSTAYPILCLVQTSTTGNSTPYNVIETSIKPGYRSLTQATLDLSITSGQQVYYICRQSNVTNGPALFEYGKGTWDNVAKTVSRDSIIQSSNGGNSVAWGASVKDLYVSDVSGALFLQAANNLSDLANIAAARGVLGLGSAALVDTAAVGGSGEAGEVPLLDGGGNIPLSMLGNAPGAPFPAGTALPFYQDSAPPGWTITTAITDKILKITKGSAASDTTGGTSDGGIGGWDNSWGITVAGHVLGATEVPVSVAGTAGSSGPPTIADLVTSQASAAHAHTLSSSTQWRPPAAYFIICTKN